MAKSQCKDKWLVLDGNYMCHRLFYAIGGLRHEDVATGVVFGFLREIVSLQEEHHTTKIAFCFDSGESLRRQRYPEYKANRKKSTTDPQELKVLQEFYAQVNGLRDKILPHIGYRNIFWAEGYEADDFIGRVAQKFSDDITTRVVMVSADQDLYQLLSGRVHMWNPHKKHMMTGNSFREEYAIQPPIWRHVKALAGCATDNVKGVEGIGEKLAAKYFAGSMKRDCVAWEKIERGVAQGILKKNLPIVTLPYKGTPDVQLAPDAISQYAWDEIIQTFGFASMKGTTPFPGRSRRPRAVRKEV